jgi:hypothetical protein
MAGAGQQAAAQAASAIRSFPSFSGTGSFSKERPLSLLQLITTGGIGHIFSASRTAAGVSAGTTLEIATACTVLSFKNTLQISSPLQWSPSQQ